MATRDVAGPMAIDLLALIAINQLAREQLADVAAALEKLIQEFHSAA